MRRLPSVLAAAGTLVLLTGCASTPSVDLDAAREWLETVQAEQSDGPGAAGVATMLVGTTTPDPDDEGDDGIRLDFENPAGLKRAEARCFGGGTVEVAVTVYSEDGARSDSFGDEIACDREPHDIALDAGPASAAVVSGRGSAETYLHVVLIEELTVER